MAWCLSTTCLCCTALSCQMHPAAKQLCELSQGTRNDPDSLRYLWAALLIWMLLQWNIGQSSSRLFYFFFFFKGCSSIPWSCSWFAAASPCMSVFLSTTRIFQDKIHLHSETKGRAEPVSCKSEWMAQLKLCGSDLMIELVIAKSSQCTQKKVLS